MERLGPDVPLHFTAFHPDWKMLDKPPTPATTLHMARAIAQEVGLNYVYTGIRTIPPVRAPIVMLASQC
jgi:pyruvate formate lyase activating enzyme